MMDVDGIIQRGRLRLDAVKKNIKSCGLFPQDAWVQNKRLSYRRVTRKTFCMIVSVEMVSYCSTNNANRSRVGLRSTFSNCHILFGIPA